MGSKPVSDQPRCFCWPRATRGPAGAPDRASDSLVGRASAGDRCRHGEAMGAGDDARRDGATPRRAAPARRARRQGDRHRAVLWHRGGGGRRAVAELGHPPVAVSRHQGGCRGAGAVIHEIEASFRRLRTSRIDLIAVHNLRDTATQLRTLRELKQARPYPLRGHDDLIPATISRVRADDAGGDARLHPGGLRTRQSGGGGDHPPARRRSGHGGDDQPALRPRPIVPGGAGQGAAAVGGQFRLRELGAVLPQVHRVAPGGHLLCAGDREGRVPARQSRRRPGAGCRTRRRGGGWKSSSTGSEAPSRTMAWSKVALLGLARPAWQAVAAPAIPPPAIEEDVSAKCIRDGGRWYPDDSRAEYCEYEV